MGNVPSKSKEISTILKSIIIDTQLGSMLAIASDTHLYLLEFADRRGLENEIIKLRKKYSAAVIPGSNKVLKQITKELNDYFTGKLQKFSTPLMFFGSDFQQNAWRELQKIPYGETRSYLEQAKKIGNGKAFRAVANANGKNQLAIVIPCHRIINTNGALGGYGGGIERKRWLIEHEKSARHM